MRLAKFKRRSEFEDPNELAKIGLRSHAFRQQVKVIGHQAIGVHLKPLPRTAHSWSSATRDAAIRQMLPAQVTANRHEIRLLAEVVGSCKTGRLAGIVHTTTVYNVSVQYKL